VIHIASGLLALLAGALALIATTGSPLHRRSGQVFALSMLLMTGSAIVIAVWLRPNVGNLIAGSPTLYLVLTGVLVVAQPVDRVRGRLAGLMLVRAQAMPNGAIDQIPALTCFMFGTVGSTASPLDARLLWAGELRGKQRLARHLWRMGYAMWIVAKSFSIGQAAQFPAEVRASGVLALPVLAVTLTLLYWLGRVAFARRPLPRTAQSTRELPQALRF
jgi:hypothetical protein